MQTRRRYIFLAATLLTFTAIGPSFAAGGRNGRLMRFPLPPMGWGSWNSFSNTIDSKIVVSQAHAIISTGMLAAGYKYMLMDEGWWIGKRDSKGNIIVDPRQWPALRPGEKPGDMRNIVRFLHRLGLKAGIYTDAGPFGCSFPYPDIGPHRPGTGSLGHYDQDMLRFAQQGFDYIKVDWCGGNAGNLDPATQYTQIGRAVERARAVTGHSLFFSICEWGNQSPWTWAPGIADMHGVMWRTGGDISWPIVDVPSEAGRRVSLQNVLNNFSAGIHPEAQHTGYYNDLDMMIVGMRGRSGVGEKNIERNVLINRPIGGAEAGRLKLQAGIVLAGCGNGDLKHISICGAGIDNRDRLAVPHADLRRSRADGVLAKIINDDVGTGRVGLKQARACRGTNRRNEQKF